ncbi:FKBP-type peptidyl-prolyl cis-trans isomerase [uncultured Draconibacterium sp.]|uniref:FKBP-type peptidyl-prolyl cis-trans isomerase n=1 Tax=uncultured Draconibacterium sp. TaxID=1573823 RepID=UPI002AA725C6|nr:FKBP-type peptidyl-prolyl cis-trans isomerase [uncultured Draconibacterium sp.]
MKKTLSWILLMLGGVAFFACNNGIDYQKMRNEELALLDEYMAVAHPGAEETSSGLYYFNEAGTGEGDTIKAGDRVQIFYATWTLDKTEEGFDSTLVDETSGYLEGHRYEPYQVTVGTGGSITGLEEGLTYMQPGTRSRLVINSELAYGQSGSGYAIGAFQTVLMEVEVYKVIPFENLTDEE